MKTTNQLFLKKAPINYRNPLSILFLMLLFIMVSCSNEEMESSDSLTISNLTSSKEALAKSSNYSYSELERLIKKMRRFHNFEVAIEQGYDQDITGYVSGMGHHYANEAFLDGVFELERPEVLLYVPDENGVMQFVGVEYLVFMDQLDDPSTPPEGFIGDVDQWVIVGPFWTLHAWVGLENPNGVFAPTNPLVD